MNMTDFAKGVRDMLFGGETAEDKKEKLYSEKLQNYYELTKLDIWESYVWLVERERQEIVRELAMPSANKQGLIYKEYLSGQLSGLDFYKDLITKLKEKIKTVKEVHNGNP